MSQQLGPYELEAELGRGGMGVVYRARDTRSGKIVALKVLLQFSADLSLLERFRREATVLRGVEHPNLVRVLDLHLEPPQPYAVFEFVEGETLRQRVLREGPLPWDVALRVLSEVASGAGAAHERNLLHRDIKPDNVLLASAGAKLVDFGLVKDLDQETLTQSGSTLGTPSYMAPEQVGSQKDRWGPQTDVYGLAATLYFALTGVPPFSGATSVSILHAVLQEPPPTPSAAVSGLPAWLDAICARGMAKQNTARFPNAVAFRLALLEGGQRAAGRRSRLLGAGVVSGLLALGVSLGVVLASAEGPVEEEAESAPLLGEIGLGLGLDLDPEREAAVAAAEAAAAAAEARKVLEGDATLGPLLKELKELTAAPDSVEVVERCTDICEEALRQVPGLGQGVDPMLERELRLLLSDALLDLLEQVLQDPVRIKDLGVGQVLIQLHELVLSADVQHERVRACVGVLSEGNPDPLLEAHFPAWVEPGQRALPSAGSPDYPRAAIELARLRLLVDPSDRDSVFALLAPLDPLDLEPALRVQAMRAAQEAGLPHVVVALLEGVKGGADLPLEDRGLFYAWLARSYGTLNQNEVWLGKLRSVILPADPGAAPRLHEIRVLIELGQLAVALERVNEHSAGPLQGWTDEQQETLEEQREQLEKRLKDELAFLLKKVAGDCERLSTAEETDTFLGQVDRALLLNASQGGDPDPVYRTLGSALRRAVEVLVNDPQRFRAAEGLRLHAALKGYPLKPDLIRDYLKVLCSAEPGVFPPHTLEHWARLGEGSLPGTESREHVLVLARLAKLRLRFDPPDTAGARRLLRTIVDHDPHMVLRFEVSRVVASEDGLPELLVDLLDRPQDFRLISAEYRAQAYTKLGDAYRALGRTQAWLERLQSDYAQHDRSLPRRLALVRALLWLERPAEALAEAEEILSGGKGAIHDRQEAVRLRGLAREVLRREGGPR